MTLFSPSAGIGGPVVTVPAFTVQTARVQTGGDPTADPTWANWTYEGRLSVIGIHYGSSAADMSYAKLKLAIGAPFTADDTYIEDVDVLGIGDKVSIASGSNLLFVGYVTAAAIGVSGEAESLIFHIMGPEWIWGGAQGGGAKNVVTGQIRRGWADDGAYISGGVGTITSNGGLFTGPRTLFNPRQRGNMTVDDTTWGSDSFRVWETENRQLNGVDLTAPWTRLQAAKTLVIWFNDLYGSGAHTGIDAPDWSATGLDDTAAMPHTDVDGLGLWDALRKVVAPEFQFFVDPRTARLTGNGWEKCKLVFFQRGTGTAASVTINPFGTPAATATPGVARLEAQKDAGKVANSVTVLGKHVRHIMLKYFGGLTPTLGAGDKKFALQHGWCDDDAKIDDYKGTDQAGNVIIDPTSISGLSATLQGKWADNFRTDGKDYASHANVFRLFLWNEGAELFDPVTKKPSYAGTAFAWYVPDLAGIADDSANAGDYTRRRRRMLDTWYYQKTIDGWRRVPPTLWIAAAAIGSDSVGAWVRVSGSDAKLDHERCAVWFTRKDLADWRPFEKVDSYIVNGMDDDRSFATLLATGKLRLLLEMSVESDWALTTKKVSRTADSGSPLVREAIFRADEDYVVSDSVAGPEASPLSITGTPLDGSDDALAYAQQLANAGKDMQTHASISLSADAALPAIGSIIDTFSGRAISLKGGSAAAGGAGRGAQIVAIHLDALSMKAELLTESAAMQLRAAQRLHGGKPKAKLRGIKADLDLDAEGAE